MRETVTQLVAILWKDTQGQDVLEYALLLVLVVLVVAPPITPLGTTIKTIFTNASNCISAGASCKGST